MKIANEAHLGILCNTMQPLIPATPTVSEFGMTVGRGRRQAIEEAGLKTGTAVLTVVANDTPAVAMDAGGGRMPSIVILFWKSEWRRNGRLF